MAKKGCTQVNIVSNLHLNSDEVTKLITQFSWEEDICKIDLFDAAPNLDSPWSISSNCCSADHQPTTPVTTPVAIA